MAVSTRSRRSQVTNYWPGFVVALSSLLLVIIFLLSLFMLSQFFLGQEISGKDTAMSRLNAQIAELTELLQLEKVNSSDLESTIATLTATLSSATRLGFVPASDTVEFMLSRALTAGSSSFYLEARPVRAAGSPVLSEPFTARAGEEIFWSIPPQ